MHIFSRLEMNCECWFRKHLPGTVIAILIVRHNLSFLIRNWNAKPVSLTVMFASLLYFSLTVLYGYFMVIKPEYSTEDMTVAHLVLRANKFFI